MLYGIICYSQIDIYRKNRTDIRYLTTNTDTEVSTSAGLFCVLKNTEYRYWIPQIQFVHRLLLHVH